MEEIKLDFEEIPDGSTTAEASLRDNGTNPLNGQGSQGGQGGQGSQGGQDGQPGYSGTNGEDIQRIISEFIETGDFSQLNKYIGDAVNSVINSTGISQG